MKRDLLKTIVLMVSIVVVTVASSLLLNLVTGPKIEADRIAREEAAAQQAAGVLLKVFPGAAGFEEITTTLTIDPTSGVSAVHKETSGKGFVVISSSTYGNMKDVVTVTVGINMDGKITGIDYSLANVNDYPVSDNTLTSFVGKDSTLGGVEFTAGATHSSTAVKAAVAAGFGVLTANDLMQAAAKTEEQVFEELLTTVLPGFVKGDDVEVTGNIYKAYKSKNGACLIAYVNAADSKVLTVTSMGKIVKVYQANCLDEKTQTYELVDVTTSSADVVTEVTEFANTNLKTTETTLNRKVQSVFGLTTEQMTEVVKEALVITEVGNITAAMSYVIDGQTYYAYQIKVINGFDNSAMNSYVIFDSEGNIYYYTTATYFFGDVHYFAPNTKFEENDGAGKVEYESQFNNINSGTYDENSVVIAGATYTTNAVKEMFKIAFAEFATIGGNN